MQNQTTDRSRIKFGMTIILIVFSLMLSGCKEKSLLLFNKNPITKENMLRNSNEFTTGKRIYYLFITQEPLKTDSVRIRVFKRDEKADYPITEVVYSNDFRLSKAQVYYYTDYVIINKAGYYCMYVYSTDNLSRFLTRSDFQVKD